MYLHLEAINLLNPTQLSIFKQCCRVPHQNLSQIGTGVHEKWKQPTKKKPGGHREINNLYKTNDNRGYQMCYTSWSAQGCPKNFKNTFEFWKHFWILKTLLNFEKKIKFFIPLYPQGTQGFIQFLLAVWLAMANMDIYIYIFKEFWLLRIVMRRETFCLV